MIEAASGSIKFNRKSGAGPNAGNKAKEGAKTNAVAHAEDDGVRYRAREQAQRTVLAAQKVVGKIEAAQHIETGAGNAEDRHGMVIHSAYCSGNSLVLGPNFGQT